MISTATITELIKDALVAWAEWCKYSTAKLKVENLEWEIEADEYIKEQTDLAAVDPDNAPAYIAAAQLRTKQKADRRHLQSISPP